MNRFALHSTGEIPWRAEEKRRRNVWVWAALVAILILYVFSALRLKPVATFGTSGDDALYFASAKALADGQGYILPSFPVRLAATKYPELYPLLLAGIWKLDPRFPGNVRLAVYLTLVFGCAALAIIFLMLRRWPGVGDWQALAIVILCGFTWYFLRLSGEVGSEIPFTATLLAAIWLAERPSGKSAAAFGAGLLAGLSVGLRSLGVAAVAGIGLFLLIKRDFRKLAWFSLAALPLALLWTWPGLTALFHPMAARSSAQLTGSGWTQTLCYYSSYACNWRMNVNSLAGFKAIVLANLKGVAQEPGIYLLDPLAVRGTLWSLVLVMLVAAASYVGIARYWRKAGWQPLLLVFLFYLLLIVPWPYTPERFLVTFLPLFFGGLWLEGRHLTSLVLEHLRPAHSPRERTTAGVLATAGLALAATVAANFAFSIPSGVAMQAATNEKMLTAERGAYAWLRQHAAPGARVIADDDGLLFLHTGRRSIVPIVTVSQGFYENDPSYARRDAEHLADVARHVGAGYWLVTASEFSRINGRDYEVLVERQKQLLAAAPVVYRSADGEVVLHDTRCMWAAPASGCTSRAANAGTLVGSGRVGGKPPRK